METRVSLVIVTNNKIADLFPGNTSSGKNTNVYAVASKGRGCYNYHSVATTAHEV